MVTLTQELVRGEKMRTAGDERVLSLYPPTARRFPLRLAAADLTSGVSGRFFQSDIRLADWSVGEVAL